MELDVSKKPALFLNPQASVKACWRAVVRVRARQALVHWRSHWLGGYKQRCGLSFTSLSFLLAADVKRKSEVVGVVCVLRAQLLQRRALSGWKHFMCAAAAKAQVLARLQQGLASIRASYALRRWKRKLLSTSLRAFERQ